MTSSSIPFTKLSSLPSYSKTSPSRLQALYADISRQKTSNPTAFQSNVSWWRATLDAIVSNGWQSSTPDKLVLKADRSLPESLRYEGTGKPLCLATVVAELSESRTLIPLSQFLSSPKSIYDPGWLPYRIASYLVGKPLWWTLQQLNIVGSDEAGHESDTQRWKKVTGEYVFVDLVERAAENVLAKQDGRTGVSLAESLYSFEGFKEEFGSMALPGVTLSDTDVKVLVKYLQRDKRVLIADKEVVKFVDLGATAEPPEISAVDRGVLELKNAVANLDAQIANIQSKIDGCTEKATAALRQKRKELALSYVRSRKQLEDVLKRRLGSLETLQSTLLRVEAAAGDIEIMKSYETSASTLRSILAHPSLQRDSVDNALDALSAATADAREVDDAIRLGGEMAVAEAGYEVGEEELEAELKALVEEGEKEKMERVETEKVMEKQREREKEVEKDKTVADEGEKVHEKEVRVPVAA
ncbi:uncharacterized protein STEHIDRAFT_119337 [Stereum hirsutum FP-91666 SS1]|uniref:uncharacterized protein n=1 Tax=Stereum hirsutum (strain FP-91666) TaxID=721885 RepID=UPI000440D9AD|nr:uncharacterized protein STEHIDRAFT_119337 [Stereum hirsutum FP-91666 SS1]EIM90317.1 hypothetical protein STEHIDRAFT_119337 [Stereum hirsutum FP-91666 SS1]